MPRAVSVSNHVLAAPELACQCVANGKNFGKVSGATVLVLC
jgi:hypothetical protein